MTTSAKSVGNDRDLEQLTIAPDNGSLKQLTEA
jgi:hypothetical protein